MSLNAFLTVMFGLVTIAALFLSARALSARGDRSANRSRPTDVPVFGVGDVRMVRTFRVGVRGGLLPLNSAVAWRDGWNTATCSRGHPHASPAPRSVRSSSATGFRLPGAPPPPGPAAA